MLAGLCAERPLSFLESNLLSQVVEKPTRIATSGTKNILDLIITSNPDVFREINIIPTHLSDHELISAMLSNEFKMNGSAKSTSNMESISNTQSFSSLNFYKADFKKINDDLEKIDWDNLKASCLQNEFPVYFYNTVLSMCCKHAPLKRISYQKRRSKYHKVCFSINRKRRKIKGRLLALEASPSSSSRNIKALSEKLISLEKEASTKDFALQASGRTRRTCSH